MPGEVPVFQFAKDLIALLFVKTRGFIAGGPRPHIPDAKRRDPNFKFPESRCAEPLPAISFLDKQVTQVKPVVVYTVPLIGQTTRGADKGFAVHNYDAVALLNLNRITLLDC